VSSLGITGVAAEIRGARGLDVIDVPPVFSLDVIACLVAADRCVWSRLYQNERLAIGVKSLHWASPPCENGPPYRELYW